MVSRITWGIIGDFPQICKLRAFLMAVCVCLAGVASMCAVKADTYTLLVLYAVVQGVVMGKLFIFQGTSVNLYSGMIGIFILCCKITILNVVSAPILSFFKY